MIGDKDDIVARLQRWLPQGWFPSDGTRINSILSGFASVLATIWTAIAYVTLQTRLATTTDGFLDLASRDFFGPVLPRLPGETDPTFSLRIRNEVFRDRQTRNAIDALLFELTGQHPIITELERPKDVGAFRYRGLAFRAVGHYASRFWRPMVFIQTVHAGRFVIPHFGGLRAPAAAFRIPTFLYTDPSMVEGSGYTDLQLFAALERIRTAGVTYWVQFLT